MINKMREKTTIFLLSSLLLSGCAIRSEKLYDGVERSKSDHAVLSSQGLYPDRQLALSITAINGKPVSIDNTAEFLILPGKYRITLKAHKDQKFNGVIFSWKEAIIDADFNAVAGHSYMPQANITSDKIRAYLLDLGESFPRGCMPMRKFLPRRSEIPVPSSCPEPADFKPAQ